MTIDFEHNLAAAMDGAKRRAATEQAVMTLFFEKREAGNERRPFL